MKGAETVHKHYLSFFLSILTGCVVVLLVAEGVSPYVELDFFVLVSLAMNWNNRSAVKSRLKNALKVEEYLSTQYTVCILS